MSAETSPISNANFQPELLIILQCPACHHKISATSEMRGHGAECPFCQHQFIVDGQPANPEPASDAVAPSAAEQATLQLHVENLNGQLRENVTQITELRGNMSRLNMELHRHQLRLDRLTARQGELNAEIENTKSQL